MSQKKIGLYTAPDDTTSKCVTYFPANSTDRDLYNLYMECTGQQIPTGGGGGNPVPTYPPEPFSEVVPPPIPTPAPTPSPAPAPIPGGEIPAGTNPPAPTPTSSHNTKKIVIAAAGLLLLLLGTRNKRKR